MIVLRYDKINFRRHEIIKEVVSTDQTLELEQFLFFFSLCEVKKEGKWMRKATDMANRGTQAIALSRQSFSRAL